MIQCSLPHAPPRALSLPLSRPARREVDPRAVSRPSLRYRGAIRRVGDHWAGGFRDVDPEARAFTPHAPFNVMIDAELRRYSERPPERQPPIDALEVFLARLFLRRYVTHCARRGRYAAMNGAARLFAEIGVVT